MANKKFGIDKQKPVPLCAQIERDVAQRIEKGEFKTFERFPDERELARLYKVSRDTVRQANTNLEKSGFLIRIQGKGTFVDDVARVKTGLHRIGLVMGHTNDTSSEFLPPVFNGIWAAIAAHGHNHELELMMSKNGSGLTEQVVAVDKKRVDGLLFLVLETDDQILLELKKKGFPFVLINYYVQGTKLNCILCNHRKAAFDATEHLIKLRHKDIAFMCGDLTHRSDIDRVQGYRMALEKHDIRYRPALLKSCLYMQEEVKNRMRELLSLDAVPTGIICADDKIAFWVAEILCQYNLSVPEDVSLIGFNDMKIASTMKPNLTTMRMPMEKIGKLGTEMLIEIMNGNASREKEIKLDFSLVERDSCLAQ